MQIIQANASDVASVSTLLQEVAMWLSAQGQEMWQLSELTASKIFDDVEAGHFYLACEGDELQGTIKILLEDPLFWPEIEHGSSLYVHRLAVRRRWAGHGVATSLLNFAVSLGKDLGRSYLRLDCAADRMALRAVYENFGFKFHSYQQVGSWYLARYEMALSL
jgi:GNAT superfamily N-acetyltransferase